MAMKLLSAATMKGAGKTAAAVGGGVVAAKVGGKVLRLASVSAAEFAAEGEWQTAATDFGGGVVLSGIGLGIGHAMGRKRTTTTEAGNKKELPSTAQQLAPYVGAGVVIGSFGVPIGRMIFDFVDEKLDEYFSDAPGASIDAPAAPGGTVVDLDDLRRRYRRVGAARVRQGLPRAGGAMAGRTGPTQLGGDVAPMRPGGLAASSGIGGVVAPSMPGGVNMTPPMYGAYIGGTVQAVMPHNG